MKEQEFRVAFMAYLSPLKAKTTEALRMFPALPMHADVHFVDFTLLAQEDFPDHLPVFVRATTISNDVYTDVGLSTIPTGKFLWADIAGDEMEDDEFVMKDTFARWFHTAWLDAGGNQYRTPAFLTLQHDIDTFCLRRGKWGECEVKYKPWNAQTNESR